MSTTDVQIDRLLGVLKDLRGRVETLRGRAAEIEGGLAEAQRAYEAKLSRANREAARLEGLKLSLLARLEGGGPPTIDAPAPSPAPVTPPEAVGPVPEQCIVPPPSLSAPRTDRKRVLADHIFFFTDGDETTVIERINALLDDPKLDVGDILELLPWGDIWKALPDWEQPAQQRKRLEGWRVALEERVAYWEREIKRLRNDQRYSLWQIKLERGEEGWAAFLDQLLRQQEAENGQTAREVAELERRLRVRRPSSGVTHG